MEKQYYFKWFNRLLLGCCLLMFVSGCTYFIKAPVVTKETSLKKLRPAQYPRFTDQLNYENLEQSIQRSLAYLRRLPHDSCFYFEDDTFTARHMIASLEFFSEFIHQNPSNQALNQFITSNFLVYQSVGGNRKKEVLFTGYYEPVIQGSLSRDDEYRYPVYAVPPDLITIDLSLFSERFKDEKIIARYDGKTVIPYYDREEIEKNSRLQETVDVLAWTNDPIDLFFLQIQGSGKIRLNDGRTIHIHYHATNGHPYRSIGRLLIDEGKIPKEEMSMQKIQAYLNETPSEINRILNYNKSYVFFKVETEGPIGSLQEKLTETRSLALDRRIFPPGALSYMEAQRPRVDEAGQIVEWTDFNGFILNQDTGGAIRGPGRADLFWGSGAYAKIAAGHMQHTGKLYFLVLRPEIL
jgi:membrane-bound lytic murein transglycosylase A